MIYLDSAAAVKLVRAERETAALTAYLEERSAEALVSSTLIEVEVPRALRRSSPGALAAVAGVLSRLARIEITAPVRALAAAYVEADLRSLDAIHVASAEQLVASGAKLTAFVTYDRRLLGAADAVGLPTAAPA